MFDARYASRKRVLAVAHAEIKSADFLADFLEDPQSINNRMDHPTGLSGWRRALTGIVHVQPFQRLDVS